jgi:predicted Zn-dependent protease
MKLEWMEKYLKEAEQLIYSNEIDRGLKLLNELLYDEPGYGLLHNYLGWAYMYYTGDAGRAELHLQMAIKFEPGYHAPYQHLGQLLLREGRYAESVGYFKTGLTITGANMSIIWESIGRAYELQTNYKEAIAAYKQAMICSVVTHEMNSLNEGIKRCRKKRWVMMFSF